MYKRQGLACAVAVRVVGEATEQFAPRLRITRVRIADASGDAIEMCIRDRWRKWF